jgi:D-galactarolactone cycloisomerase
MKITAVDTYYVRHELPRRIGPSTFYYGYRDSLLVKISTDEGLVGWGETAPMAGTRAAIEGQLKSILIGQDPLHHRPLWRQLWGPNFGDPLAVGAIDIALNDLRGKALNLSIAELFGGRLRERVPVYASAMNYTEGIDPLDQYPAEAARLVQERGLRALKMRIGGQPIRRDVAVAQAVREAVGPDVKLMADGNGAYTLGTAIQMGRELEQLGFYWFEEPLPQPGYIGYETLAATLDINIAAGEVLGAREAFKEVLQRRAMDIVQPDVSLCGGIGEGLFIAELARLWGIPCLPHCWGGGITVLATIHLLSLLPDASWARETEMPMLEFDVYENPFRDELLAQPVQIQDGMVDVPTGPGLGVEIVEEVLLRYRVS